MALQRQVLFCRALVGVAAFAACLILTSAAGAAPAGPLPPGLHDDLVFDRYSPLSRSAELLRRMLSPLAERAAEAKLKSLGKRLAEQPVDVARERFVLYVPPKPPPEDYGLMVFVPPSDRATLPDGWASVLDRYGVIFVSADRSGNDQSVFGRRAPLALIAAKNVMASYPVDTQRIYIAGFSGGSRVALKLALHYPDLFTGALLNGGSDPIGVATNALPSGDLFQRFQEHMRLVYVTGEQDVGTLGLDAESVDSMQRFCVDDFVAKTMPDVGHAVASPEVLSEALRLLLDRRAPDPAKLNACRARVERELAAKIDQVRSLVAAGRRDAARQALIRLDAEFGGLAAPASLELAERCNCGPE